MGYGLTLVGGRTGGAAYVGVLKVPMEAGLHPDAVAGASVEGIVAGLFASGISVSRMEQAVFHLEKHGDGYLNPDHSGLLVFTSQLLTGKGVNLSGLTKGDKLRDYFFQMTGRKHVDEAVFKLVIPAVDPISGSTIRFINSDQTREMEHVTWEWNGYLREAMMAGASMSAIFAPRKLGKYFLVDGDVTNIPPANLLQAVGIRNVLAVGIGGDYEAPLDCSAMRVAFRSFPIMDNRLKDCIFVSEVLLLKPSLSSKAGPLIFELMGECMRRGYEYTRKIPPQIHKIPN